MPESESILEVLERELDFAGAQVDPELLVREFADRPLPHDPELDELSEAAVIQVAECPICGCSDAVPRFAVRGTSFRLVVCADCGLGSLDPKPTPEAVARFYPPEYYGSAGAKFAPFIEWMVRKSAAWTAKGRDAALHRHSSTRHGDGVAGGDKQVYRPFKSPPMTMLALVPHWSPSAPC